MNLEQKQADMRRRWQKRAYPAPPAVRNVVIRAPTRKAMKYGTTPRGAVKEFADLGQFVREECSPEVRRIVHIMVMLAMPATQNEVLIALFDLFKDSLGETL